MLAASALASRLILSAFPEPLASVIRFSLRVRARISSKFSIGPRNGSFSQPIRSLLQLNLTTSTTGDSLIVAGIWARTTIADDANKRAKQRYFIAALLYLMVANDTEKKRRGEAVTGRRGVFVSRSPRQPLSRLADS